MKLSITDAMVKGKSLTEKAYKAKEWGYDGMAIFMEYSSWNERILDELLEMKDITGVAPCEFVFLDPVYGHLMDKDPEVRKKAVALYTETIEVCKKLGAITEIEYEYCIQDPLPLFEPYKKMPADEEALFLSVITTLGEIAEDSPAQILLEPCNRYECRYCTRLDDYKRLVGMTSLNNVGILADFFHMSIEENDIPSSIISAGELIRHVHLGDSNRLLPGYGHTDFTSAFTALKQIGFKGYMNLECGIPGDPERLLPECAEYLHSIIEKI